MMKRSGLLLTGLLVFSAAGVMLFSPAGCVPRSEWSPGHTTSPYQLNVSFPVESYHDGKLWAAPGETIVLSANIVSLIDDPFAVVIIRADTLMPCSPYITFQADDQYVTVPPKSDITVTVFCNIAVNTPSGLQQTGLRCRLLESISGMVGSGVAFDVFIK
jgi:hypothetical protein